MNAATHPRAFTLVETLVTISVIAILMALLAPALAAVRDRSRRLVSESNLRSIGQLFAVHLAQADARYPAPDPTVFYPTSRPDLTMTIGHWQASDNWPFLLSDLAPWWEYERMYLAPGAVRSTEPPVIVLPLPSYRYSAAFLGHPALWGPYPVPDPAALRRPAAQHQVVYPAQKTLMWDWELPYVRRALKKAGEYNLDLDEPTPMLFADAHVTGHTPSHATDPVFNQDPQADNRYARLHNTPHGVRGLDYP